MATKEESALAAVNDALVILRQDKGIAQNEFDGTVESVLGRKCRAVYDACRIEVMLARDWNFTRTRISVESTYDQETDTWKIDRPVNALKICCAFDHSGEKLPDWTIVGDNIYSSRAIESLEIHEDVKNVGMWPPLVRRALVHALARDLAIPVTGRRSDLETVNSLYMMKLKDAALHDARETHPGDEAWGRNTYADRIKGTFLRKREVRVI